ncbi:VOC family protein [Georgenia alba]|uniref:VOC family protein n=1 Tax=Georgenia alba TaxID=2233858 RepID=A0ABW2Q3Q1_9MICO
MSVKSVVVNTVDVARSVEFYREFLAAEPVGEVTSERAELDLVTATLRLVRVSPGGEPSSWEKDDTQRGFRHIGFKVAAVDPMVERLKAADVPFHMDPIDATGGVRITFFYDPDGTLLELVEGDLKYTAVLDERGAAAERALGVPERPRFDHVAVTAADADAIAARYEPLGFAPVGTIAQTKDPRGFNILFLHSSVPTILEIFTYESGTHGRDAQVGVPGFQAVVLDRPLDGLDGFTPVGAPADGVPLNVDSDSLVVAVEP